ncbi:hypothetical protein VB735_28275 [Halotia wernerae UHCC 0503]|nr:hypothetical protein [Halotia wernerae UHCC 0503]
MTGHRFTKRSLEYASKAVYPQDLLKPEIGQASALYLLIIEK